MIYPTTPELTFHHFNDLLNLEMQKPRVSLKKQGSHMKSLNKFNRNLGSMCRRITTDHWNNSASIHQRHLYNPFLGPTLTEIRNLHYYTSSAVLKQIEMPGITEQFKDICLITMKPWIGSRVYNPCGKSCEIFDPLHLQEQTWCRKWNMYAGENQIDLIPSDSEHSFSSFSC